MTRRTITTLWLGGLVAIFAGLVLVLAGVSTLGLGDPSVVTWRGYDVTGLPPDGAFWPAITLVVAGGLVGGLGAVAQGVAWVLALIATAQAESWIWFALLLVLGLLGLGFLPMVAYMVADPDPGQARPPLAGAGPPAPPMRIAPSAH